MVAAYIGLGSNLDGPEQQILRALDALARLPESTLGAHSSLYRSPPMGPQDQPDYVNAVAALETALTPLVLLEHLQALERAQGRVRQSRWGARTLDLDLLLYGDERISIVDVLEVPHPGLAERPFVLVPLVEIAPQLVVPGAGRVDVLLESIADCGIERL